MIDPGEQITEAPLHIRTFKGVRIAQTENGFFNADAICKAGGKSFAEFMHYKATKALFVEALLCYGKEQIDYLFYTPTLAEQYGEDYCGPWLHTIIAIPLAHWVHPRLGFQVVEWSFKLMAGKGKCLEPNILRVVK